MPAFGPWRRATLALLICLFAAACGSGGGTGGGGIPGLSAPGAAGAGVSSSGGTAVGGAAPGSGSGADGAPAAAGTPAAAGAPGGSGGEGGPGAPGAPITIPDVEVSQGLDVDVVRNSIETGQGLPGEAEKTYDGVIAQCGGQLCVTIGVRPATSDQGGDGFTQCQFVSTDPAPGSQLPRGGTIWLLTGTQPCQSSPDPGSDQSSPDPGSDQSSPDPGSDQSSPDPASGQSSPDPGGQTAPDPGSDTPPDGSGAGASPADSSSS